MRIVPYAPEHRPGVIALFAAELWPSYTRDPMRTCAALRAPGVTSLVALDDDRVVGIVQVQSDGAIQAHLSTLVVARESGGGGSGDGCSPMRCRPREASGSTSSRSPTTSTPR